MFKFSLIVAFAFVLAFSSCLVSFAAPIPSGSDALAARGKVTTEKDPAPAFDPIGSKPAAKDGTALADLKEGDVIYAEIIIDKADVADASGKSTTAKKIRQGKPVKRICVVLANGPTGATVTYFATFGQAKSLPTSFADKSIWYPFEPATKESTHDPLPAFNEGKAQWASLRKKQHITVDKVELIGSIPQASADKILAAMKG